MRVDLLYFSSQRTVVPQWELGNARILLETPRLSAPIVDAWLNLSMADYVLFWDMQLGHPHPSIIMDILRQPGDVWHAGLRLGTSGLPGLIDFVSPTWMLNRDAPSDVEATSWRLSLRACLARVDVLRQLGTIDPVFDTLSGAGLQMGCRYITRGAFVRHVPGLLPVTIDTAPVVQQPSLYDELRFIGQQYGLSWAAWAVCRAALNGCSLVPLVAAYLRLRREGIRPMPAPYQRPIDASSFALEDWHEKVTVLIPTLERYPYLVNELVQLRDQTIRPLEIIVVDQTPVEERDKEVPLAFPDLPVHTIYQDTLGQCTAWNAGLLASRGEFILFLGDDADQIVPTFLEHFLRTFQATRADMIASRVDEVGAGPVPENFRLMRIADTFPISMIRRDVFRRSGLLDFAYDRGARADHDLGMRCYLNGALMILNPDIRILHHRAPRGGLRKHGARVITFASSRRSLIQRNLPAVTEIYLALRYFTARQIQEDLWLRVFGTMRLHGSKFRQLVKFMIGFFLLPKTLRQIRDRRIAAEQMLLSYPQIPVLPETEAMNRNSL